MNGQSRTGPLTWGIVACLIMLVLATRAIPYEYRLFNMTAVGALALFVGARIGLWQAVLVVLITLLASDLALFAQNHFDLQYLPSPVVYGAFAMYILLGWLFLRSTEYPLTIGTVAVWGGLFFFLSTNLGVWLGTSHMYERTADGLLLCYTAALPFYKGTLFGDLLFTGLAFGAHAVFSRAWFPKERVVPITVND